MIACSTSYGKAIQYLPPLEAWFAPSVKHNFSSNFVYFYDILMIQAGFWTNWTI